MQSTIYFYGGAGTVTGSNFLLNTGNEKILVDCGLFQGEHSVADNNWESFPFDPKEIPFLINTHAHIDHIGRIPKLVRDGFRGRIISTEATRALAEPMLEDALKLTRTTAEHLGREAFYDEHDIKQALELWEGISYHTKVDLGDGVSVELLNSGHILGSAMARFTRGDKTVVFTGDLGGGNSPLLPACESPTGTNYLVMESVYGDRVQEGHETRLTDLEKIIEDTAARGGTLLIPAFSTERTQDILFEIRALLLEKRVPSIPVYLDSPLAEKITASYVAHPSYFSEAIQERVRGGEAIFSFPELHYVGDQEESQKILAREGAKIILAGSGMSNGGRVISHEHDVLQDPSSTVLIVGYQAAGSLGRKLAEGLTSVTIRGEKIPVKCHIEKMYSYSAHMDGEQLLEFVQKIKSDIAHVFVVMGEPSAASFLAQRIRDFLGLKATTPESGETTAIDF